LIFVSSFAGNLRAVCPSGYTEVESAAYSVVANSGGCASGSVDVIPPAILPRNGCADCDAFEGPCSQTAGVCGVP
jgi:hypothetical protein